MKTMLEGNRQQMTTTVLFENKKRCFGLKLARARWLTKRCVFAKSTNTSGAMIQIFGFKMLEELSRMLFNALEMKGYILMREIAHHIQHL